MIQLEGIISRRRTVNKKYVLEKGVYIINIRNMLAEYAQSVIRTIGVYSR